MPSNSENNKRIIKNTLALYFRQIITMAAALFTLRIILQTLGVKDYGINNVVGGVVGMFGFLGNTLMGITQRFISVELGEGGNIGVLRKIFSTSMILHIAAGVVAVILAETIGLWFLNNKLVIPPERMAAANWVYQFTVFGFLLSLLNAPFTALIISHEDMHIYGYMGIFDVAMRLVTVYLLVIINADKLVFMAMFGFAVTCAVWLLYFIYCRRKYEESKFSFAYDKSLTRELGGFGGYVLVSGIFEIFLEHGRNIMLNVFFGPAVNAAKGLANSVNNALLSFGYNFRQALVPQLMKSYAANDDGFLWSLVERGTRISYFLSLIFSVPLLLETDFVFRLWLGKVPEYTVIFTRVMIVDALIAAALFAFWNIVNASGKLKAVYGVSYMVAASVLVLSYLLCRGGYLPQYVLAVLPLIRLCGWPVYFTLARKRFRFPVKFFVQKALLPTFFVSAVSFLPFYFVNKLFYESPLRSCVVIITSMLWTGTVIAFAGLKRNERVKIIAIVKRKTGLTV